MYLDKVYTDFRFVVDRVFTNSKDNHEAINILFDFTSDLQHTLNSWSYKFFSKDKLTLEDLNKIQTRKLVDDIFKLLTLQSMTRIHK